MIRQIDGQYEPNKRSKFLQKYKMFMEEEFEIISFHDGEGHDKNMVIWECKTSAGKLFSVKPRGTFANQERKNRTNLRTNLRTNQERKNRTNLRTNQERKNRTNLRTNLRTNTRTNTRTNQERKNRTTPNTGE